MSVGGIYKINSSDGRSYIGSTIDFKKRWYSHRQMLKAGKHASPALQKIFNEDGPDSLSFEILLICDKENCLMYEGLLIDKIKPELNTFIKVGKIRKKRDAKEDRFSVESIRLLKRSLGGGFSELKNPHGGVDAGFWEGKRHPMACLPPSDEARKKMSEAAKAREARKRSQQND